MPKARYSTDSGLVTQIPKEESNGNDKLCRHKVNSETEWVPLTDCAMTVQLLRFTASDFLKTIMDFISSAGYIFGLWS